MTATLRKLWLCRRAASAAEFSLVLPLLLLLLFLTVDAGRYLWEVNQAEKATQMGARLAVVTTPVSTGLINADFVSADVPAGELIPASAIGKLECSRTSCTCTDCGVTVGSTVDTARFDAIVTRMQAMYPNIVASKVLVTYRGSGFGFAGDAPGGGAETMEISPLVTVSLTDMTFSPISTFMQLDVPMPTAATTLPSEDASGSVSN